MASGKPRDVLVSFQKDVRGGCTLTEQTATIAWTRYNLEPPGPVGLSAQQVLGLLMLDDSTVGLEDLEIYTRNLASLWWPSLQITCEGDVFLPKKSSDIYLSTSPWAMRSLDKTTLTLLSLQMGVNFELYKVTENDTCNKVSIRQDHGDTTIKFLVRVDYQGDEMYQVLEPEQGAMASFPGSLMASTVRQTAPALSRELERDSGVEHEITDQWLLKSVSTHDRHTTFPRPQSNEEEKATGRKRTKKTDTAHSKKGRKVSAADMGFHSLSHSLAGSEDLTGPTGKASATRKHLSEAKALAEVAERSEGDFPKLTDSSDSEYLTPGSSSSLSYCSVASHGVLESSSETSENGSNLSHISRWTNRKSSDPAARYRAVVEKGLVNPLLPSWLKRNQPKKTVKNTPALPGRSERLRSGITKAKDARKARALDFREERDRRTVPLMSMATDALFEDEDDGYIPPKSVQISRKKMKAEIIRWKMQVEKCLEQERKKRLKKKELKQESENPEFYKDFIPVTGRPVLPSGVPLEPEVRVRPTTADREHTPSPNRPYGTTPSQVAQGTSQGTLQSEDASGLGVTDSANDIAPIRSSGGRRRAQRPFVLKGACKGGLKRGKLYQGDMRPMSSFGHSGKGADPQQRRRRLLHQGPTKHPASTTHPEESQDCGSEQEADSQGQHRQQPTRGSADTPLAATPAPCSPLTEPAAPHTEPHHTTAPTTLPMGSAANSQAPSKGPYHHPGDLIQVKTDQNTVVSTTVRPTEKKNDDKGKQRRGRKQKGKKNTKNQQSHDSIGEPFRTMPVPTVLPVTPVALQESTQTSTKDTVLQEEGKGEREKPISQSHSGGLFPGLGDEVLASVIQHSETILTHMGVEVNSNTKRKQERSSKGKGKKSTKKPDAASDLSSVGVSHHAGALPQQHEGPDPRAQLDHAHSVPKPTEADFTQGTPGAQLPQESPEDLKKRLLRLQGDQSLTEGDLPLSKMVQQPYIPPSPFFVPESMICNAEQQQQVNMLVRFMEKAFASTLWVKDTRISHLGDEQTFCLVDAADISIYSQRLNDFFYNLIGSEDESSLEALSTHGLIITGRLALQVDNSLLGPIIFQDLVDPEFWCYLPKPTITTCILVLALICIGRLMELNGCILGSKIKELAVREISERQEIVYTILENKEIMEMKLPVDKVFKELFLLTHSQRFATLNNMMRQLSGIGLTRLDMMNPSATELRLCYNIVETLLHDEIVNDGSAHYTQSISMDLMRLSAVVDKCLETFNALYPNGDTRVPAKDSQEITSIRISAMTAIKEYFEDWSAGHSYVLVNPAMLEASIKCLAQHASRIASYRESEMSVTDFTVHKRLMTKLFKILEGVELMPMVEVCKQVSSHFSDMIAHLPSAVRQEVRRLYNSLIYCNSYTDAWQFATRIKGVAYEGFFSQKFKLKYCPELDKPTLGEIIKVSYPLLYERFLSLSAKCPEVRTIVPDFYLHRRSVMGPEDPSELRDAIDSASEQDTPATSDDEEVTIEPSMEEPMELTSGQSKYKIAPDEPSGTKKQFSQATPDTDIIRSKCVRAISTQGQLGRIVKDTVVVAEHSADDESPIVCKVSPASSQERELIIFEVGFVTNPEQKIEIDMSKWGKAIRILEMLKIGTTLIIATDVSSRSIDKWWISPSSAGLLKRSVGTLFFYLVKHTPHEIKDRIVSGLSTLKHSVNRKAGSTVKTPVTVADVKEYFVEGKLKIGSRPTGTKLPSEVMKSIEDSLVNGCAISEEGADKVIQMLRSSSRDIISQYTMTVNAEELLDNEYTKLKVLGSWILQEYRNRTCPQCFDMVDKSRLGEHGFIEELVYMLNQSKNLKDCCAKHIHNLPCQGPLPLFMVRCPPLGHLASSRQAHMEEVDRTELDVFMGCTFPARTPAQKKTRKVLEQLCRAVVDVNGISAIKNSKGQIFLNTDLNTKISEKICVPRKVIKPISAKGLQVKVKKVLAAVKEQFNSGELKNYSDFHKDSVARLVEKMDDQANSSCILKHQWVMRILDSLRLTSSPSELLLSVNKTIEDRKANAPLNDSFRIPDKCEVTRYFQNFKDGLLSSVACVEPYSLDCVLFKEVFDETVRRLASTPYVVNLSMITNITKILLKLGWFQNLVLHSKICMLYLTACSEFSSSGVKVLKVPHTALNLVVKLSADKKTNSSCTLFDLDFNEVVPPFFMNRCVATIGQAMPYVLLVLLIQSIQNYKCLDALSCPSTLNYDKIREGIDLLLDNCHDAIIECYEGDYATALAVFKSCWLTKKLHNEQSPAERLERVIASFTVGMGCVLVPAMLLNSLNFNSQIQKMRFTTIMGLSLIGRPADMGAKMYSPCRRIESYVAKLYLQLSSYSALSGTCTNPENWKEDIFYPSTTINSLSLYGMLTSGDRQLLTDIYLVHIHNKELDNFDEGSIAVLEELADRHFSWEAHVTKMVETIRSSDSSRKQVKQALQELRLLVGAVKLDQLPLRKGDSDFGDIDESKSECSRGSSSFRASSVVSSVRSWGRDTVYCISDSSELYPNFDQGGQLSLRQSELCTIYTPNLSKIKKDMSLVLSINPSYTMGCPEIVQAMTEYGKRKFPEIVIHRAKKDARNWASIASVSESTAIVPGPLRVFDIRRAADTMKRMQGTKLKKLLKNRLVYIGGFAKKEKTIKEVTQDLEELLCCIETIDPKVKEEIKKSVVEARSLRQVTWQYASKLPLDQTLMTIEGHNIFYWLKSLQKSMAKLWNLEPLAEIVNHPTILNVVETIKNLSQGQPPVVTIEYLKTVHNESINLWKKALDIFIGALELETEEMSKPLIDLKDDFQQLFSSYQELISLKRENPDLTFKKQERRLRKLEEDLIKNHNKAIAFYCNILFIACFACPWFRSLKHQEGLMLKAIFSEIGLSFNTEKLSTKYMSALLPLLCTRQLVSIYMADKLGEGNMSDYWLYEPLSKFCIAMFSSNSNPLSYVHSSRLSNINTDLDGVLNSAAQLIALYAMEGKDYDFSLTVKTIGNSSQMTAHKLTGRMKGERLPRSTRSKVIYEIIKLMGTSTTAILQEVVFDKILDPSHEFFATLAPKAQLGGNRDLFVQETGTKLVHAVTEIFSKTLLSQTKDDGLTNQHLKEEILSTAHSEFWLSNERHGTTSKLASSALSSEEPKINFYKVLSVAGDNTKWGPIHCCSYFSLMYQQLLIKHPDWKHFIMLVMLKDLNKEIEIPSASVSKIMNSLLHDELFIKNTKGRTHPAQLQAELARVAKNWSWKPLVQDIILNYLVKGKLCMQCYNHMGQGIHHATSSVLTSLLAKLIEDLLVSFIEQELPGLHCKIVHAGSSDDYAKVISTYGELDCEQYQAYETNWKYVMLDAKNLMSALCRLVQVKDSSKTLSGTVVAEFYSEFVFFFQKCPAPIKFVETGIINSSITSPVTMSQTCQVGGQQSMYNSVPHLTNFAFTIFRQQIYFNFIENFIRKYGRIILTSISSFGRLYIPVYSNMIEAGLVVEDLEQVVSSLSRLSEFTRYLPLAEYDVVLPGGEKSIVEPGLGSSSSSDIDTSIRTEETIRPISRKPQKAKLPKDIEHVADKVRRQLLAQYNSDYMGDCDRIVRQCYDGHQCVHHYNLGAISLMKTFLSSQPSQIRSICLSPRGDLRFDTFELAKSNYSVSLTAQVMSDVLTSIIFSYYKRPQTLNMSKRLKASYNREESSFFEDPFIQVKPSSLERELKNLREARSEIMTVTDNTELIDNYPEFIADQLVKLNNMTEDYIGESDRLLQAITSRSIIWGLAGGLKELSIPIYSIFFKAYFFIDRTDICSSNKWVSIRHEGHMDSSAQPLGTQVRTKFGVWLDKIFQCPMHSEMMGACLVLDDNARTCKVVQASYTENGEETELHYIAIDGRLCEKYANEISDLILQFSDHNRLKVKVLESSREVQVRPADMVRVSKVRLFSCGSASKVANNPAVVIAYRLCPEAVYRLKPRGINYSSLETEGTHIEDIHPAIRSEILKIIAMHSSGEAFAREIAQEKIRMLTTLCRMTSSSRFNVTSFYAIRPTNSHDDTNISEILSYGIQEGKYVSIKQQTIDYSTYSERYFIIIEAISVINHLPYEDDVKSRLMQNFLTWVPTTEGIISILDCGLNDFYDSLVALFGNTTLADTLDMEQYSTHKADDRRSCSYLSMFALNAQALQAKVPYTGGRISFSTRGDQASSGNFTLASAEGNAVGVFRDGMLHIHIDHDSPILMTELAIRVLTWVTGHDHKSLDRNSCEEFLRLLPRCKKNTAVSHEDDGQLLILKPSSTIPIYLHPVQGFHRKTPYIRLKRNILNYPIEKEQPKQSINCSWQPGKLVMYYPLILQEMQPSGSTLQSLEILRKSGLNSEYNQLRKEGAQSSRKVVIATIKLNRDVSLRSVALLHMFLNHLSGFKSYSLGVPEREAVLQRMVTQTSMIQLQNLHKLIQKAEEHAGELAVASKGDMFGDSEVGTPEARLRDILNNTLKNYKGSTDWVAIQAIIDFLNMDNSMVVNESLELRGNLNWKVVSTSLSVIEPRNYFSQLVSSLVGLASYRCAPLLCRLVLVEEGIERLRKLSGDILRILQYEQLKENDLHCFFTAACIFNAMVPRGKQGLLSWREILRSILPIRTRGPRNSLIEVSSSQGFYFLRVVLKHENVGYKRKSDRQRMLLMNLQGIAEVLFPSDPLASFLSVCHSQKDDQEMGEYSYELMLLPLTAKTNFHRICSLLVPGYTKQLGKSLACVLLQLLLGSDLNDQDCSELVSQYQLLSQGIAHSTKPVSFDSDEEEGEIDLLQLLKEAAELEAREKGKKLTVSAGKDSSTGESSSALAVAHNTLDFIRRFNEAYDSDDEG
nr:RNA-dependent RNA polymerase [Beiji nairovirus]